MESYHKLSSQCSTIRVDPFKLISHAEHCGSQNDPNNCLYMELNLYQILNPLCNSRIAQGSES